MEKSKIYKRIKFSPEKLKEGIAKWMEIVPLKDNIEELRIRRSIYFESESLSYDKDGEFYADFAKDYENAYYSLTGYGENGDYSFSFASGEWINTKISISAPTRAEIEEVFYVFDKDWKDYLLPEKESEKMDNSPTIFIGHGRNPQWKELKDHLSDKHNIKVETYETGARAGHTIRDILDDMLTKSSMAFLILTGEDELIDGKLAARPNVIHETGLFQGRLGFSRAIVLIEDGTEEFSNLFGIQQIRYSKDNIKETFGEVLATIKREFK